MNRILIALPCSWTHINSLTALSINDLVKNNPETDFVVSDKGTISAMRNELVRYFLNKDWTHLLFIDGDMVFPKDLPERLLKHNKDIISGYYATRYEPHYPLLLKCIDKEKHKYEVIPPNQWQDLMEVDATGCGCMLIKRFVFEKISKPWFEFGYSKELQKDVGEDIIFCEKARDLGFKIYVDLTTKCGHITTKIIMPPEKPKKLLYPYLVKPKIEVVKK